MLLNELVHYTDQIMSKADARLALMDRDIDVIWYTNIENTQSVVHSHPYYFELIYPISGEVLYSSNGSLYSLHTRELICFPVDVYHSGKFDVGRDESQRIVVKINRQLWKESAEQLGLADADWNGIITILNADITNRWEIPALFLRMAQTYQMDEPYRSVLLKNQLQELMLILHQNMRDKKLTPPVSSSVLVAKAVRYLQFHYTDPNLTVSQLAQQTYVSREHLSRKFKEYTLESVHSYLTNLRMQHFRGALEQGKSILEACTESGFSDYTSFLKTFRKTYGITPAEYRSRLMKNSFV